MERPARSGRFTEVELINLLAKILSANGAGRVEREPLIGPRLRPDLIVHGDSILLIEVKNVSPQTRTRLFGVIEQLRSYRDGFRAATGITPQLALFTPGVLSGDNIGWLESNDIAVYDKAWLLDKARSAGLLDEALAILEPEEGPSVVTEPPFVGRLKALGGGKPDWRPYQRLCLEIFDHLFSPPLSKGLWENANAAGVNRRDIIMPNYSTEGFWYYLRQSYRADHLVIDAKNYTGTISKKEILQLANYLSQHGTGLFGIILTRTGDDRSAQYVRREQWMMHNKLILVLNDEDLIQMLSAQAGGERPEALVQQKIEDFRLAI